MAGLRWLPKGVLDQVMALRRLRLAGGFGAAAPAPAAEAEAPGGERVELSNGGSFAVVSEDVAKPSA